MRVFVAVLGVLMIVLGVFAHNFFNPSVMLGGFIPFLLIIAGVMLEVYVIVLPTKLEDE